jgi:hypothetical protein
MAAAAASHARQAALAPHGFVGAAEFGSFLAFYDTLMARFGVAADERFAAVLNGITKTRRQRYNAAYQARRQDDATVVAQRLARAAYMRGYRSRPRTPEQQEGECAGQAPYMKRYRATRTEVGWKRNGNRTRQL